MITQKQRKRLDAAIKRHVEAKIEDSWRGSKMPEDFPVIDAETRAARQHLNRVLGEITEKPVEQDPYLEGIMKRDKQL
jgi:hypothetical protein